MDGITMRSLNLTEQYTVAFETNNTNASSISEVDPTKVIVKKVYDILLIVVMAAIMVSMGCTIKVSRIKEHLRRPWGILIGLLCQFIIFPPLTFGVAHLMKLPKWTALGMIMLGTCPGGSISNILTFWMKGDVALSVTMTTVSTLVGIGAMPLNLWLYSRSWTDQSAVVPYVNIVIALVSMLVPVSVGVLILAKLPRVAALIMKVAGVGTLLIILTIYATSSYLFPELYLQSWQIWVACLVLSILGLSFGFIIARIARLEYSICRAICIETGCQNVALCLTLVLLSFGVDVFIEVMVFPALYGSVNMFLIMAIAAVIRLYGKYTKYTKNKGYDLPNLASESINEIKEGKLENN